MLSVVVATLVFLPPLVRAADHLGSSRSSSPIRLNRGFERPPAKSEIAPPVDLRRWSVLERSLPVEPRQVVVTASDRLPALQPDLSPDALRGPPRLFS